MSLAGLWVITWGAGTQGANQVEPRHQGAHLVCAAIGVVVLLDP